MYRTVLDNYPVQQFLHTGIAMNVTQTYLAWSAADREVWLAYLSPTAGEESVFRPSLLANNLEALTIGYYGTFGWECSQLMARLQCESVPI